MWPLGVVALLAGGYYLSRLIPRVAQRVSPAATGTAAASAAMLYRQYEHAFLPAMTRREALLILGFDPADNPDAAAVHKRYRHLMSALHTDVNGSPLLSQKINEAREYLGK